MKEIIKKMYGFEPSNDIIKKIYKWREYFIEYNSRINLMSKNDVPYLYEKHMLDSLAISLIPEFKDGIKVLDIGTGGGFPSVIIAIFYSNIHVIALDSIAKKTEFIDIIKEELKLDNLEIITGRAEDIKPLEADILVNRAVGTIDKVWNISGRHLKTGGTYVSYKARTAKEEAKIAEAKYKKLQNPRFYPYKLPLKEDYTRELVVFSKV